VGTPLPVGNIVPQREGGIGEQSSPRRGDPTPNRLFGVGPVGVGARPGAREQVGVGARPGARERAACKRACGRARLDFNSYFKTLTSFTFGLLIEPARLPHLQYKIIGGPNSRLVLFG
jgi:hypothetical protein